VKHYKFFLHILILIPAIYFLVSCSSGDRDSLPSDLVNNPNSATGKSDLSKLPAIKFDQDMHDFGKILEGETVTYSFRFTNTGRSDLVIADVSTSCGCTVPSWPKNPVKPGEQENIKVTFNSAGRRGYQTKMITVVANTQPNVTLVRIKAQVVSPGN
jgi:hypothetical protein